MKDPARSACALLSCALLISCGGGGGSSSSGPPNSVPVASITATPNSGLAELSVSLDGAASRDADGQITKYSWAFGDNTAAGSGSTVTHLYRAAGQYTVQLTVTDDRGATATATAAITVRPITAAVRYSVKFLPSADGSPYQYMHPTAINDNGHVVGHLTALVADKFVDRAFFFDGVITRELPTLGGLAGAAYDINRSGTIVGTARNAAGYQHAFSYSNGAITDLGTLTGTSLALAINESGRAAGYAWSGANARAVLFSDGTVRDLGTLGGEGSAAFAINSGGDVVGTAWTTAGTQHAFLYRNGQMQDVGTLGGNNSDALGINASGQVIGTSDANFPNGETGYPYLVGFVYQNGTKIEIRPPTMQSVVPSAINDAAQVIGVVWESSDYAGYPFVWHSSNGMRKLNDLIDPTIGCHVINVYDVNNSGQIVGVAGCVPDKYPWDDATVGVLLTPES